MQRLAKVNVRRASYLPLSLSLFVFFSVDLSFSADARRAANVELPSQDVSVETRDGLLTAIFSHRADDSILRAALPALASQGVQSMVLRGAPVHDMRLLAGMTGLKALDLSGTQVRDLMPLSGLTSLKLLNLQFLRLVDLKPLAEMKGLRSLNLGGTEIHDLAPLAGLTELQDLVLAVTKVKDLTPLTWLRQMTALDLGSTWVSDIRALSGMTNLLFLSLNGTTVDDVQPLLHLVKLQTLDLGGTQVTDIQPLAALRDLRSLNLEGTLVTDVEPLAKLSALRSVAVGGLRIKDVAPLAHLAGAPAAPANQLDLDVVLGWNDQTNRAIQATRMDAFAASRALAIESIAVLDTIKSIDGTAAFLVRLPPPSNISVNIAVAAAAHAALSHLFPSRHATLDTALAATLAQEPAGPARARAVAFGEAMANVVLMVRDGDGSMSVHAKHVKTHMDDTASGAWRPTPPGFEPAMHMEWAAMQPFALTRPDQFRPAAPPAPNIGAFQQGQAYVASIGSLHSTTRTPEQTEIAHYWSDAIGTYAPAGHWNAIAAHIVGPLQLGLAVEAELFAELNVAMADAGIAMADAKYTYWESRPVTVIRAGGFSLAPNPEWEPLLNTPNHPSYISGHSSFSGAAAVVLTSWFGTHPFTFVSANLPGVTRDFINFQQAAEEAAASRVYGGIHFPFDNASGLVTGRAIGAWTMGIFQRMSEDHGPVIVMMDPSMSMPDSNPHAVIGCALDNLSPVTTVSVQLDDTTPFSVAVDDKGFFTLPPNRLDASVRHTAVVMATSISGRSSTVHVAID